MLFNKKAEKVSLNEIERNMKKILDNHERRICELNEAIFENQKMIEENRKAIEELRKLIG